MALLPDLVNGFRVDETGALAVVGKDGGSVGGATFLGPFDDLTVGDTLRELDLVAFGGRLYSRLTPGVVESDFDAENWELIGTPDAELQSGIAAKQPLAEKGQADGYAELDSAGKVPNTQLPPIAADRPVLLSYTVPGELAVGAGQSRLYLPTDGEIQSIEAAVGTAPDGTPVLVDVNKNGSTIFTSQPGRPSIPIAGHTSGRKTPNTVAFAEGDYLTVDVDQVGSEPDGSVLFVSLESTSSGGASVSTFSVTRPAAAQTGDVTLICLWSESATTALWTPPGGSGWTQVAAAPAGGAVRMHWFYRVDDGSAGPWEFAAAASHRVLALRKLTYRGAHQTTPIDSYAFYSTNGNSLGTWPVPALTTVNPDCTEVLGVFQTASGAIALPAGFTNRLNFGGAASLYAFADRQHEAAGVLPALTLNPAPATAGQAARIALRPAAPGAWSVGEDLTVLVRYLEG